jgi:Cytochrome c7 and related cytochrome c
MAQLFPPSANPIARLSIAALAITLSGLGWTVSMVDRSSFITKQNIPRNQPIPFSHEHHVRGLGIDCRYCHGSVEDSSFAGVPPTKTCMTCHSVIWTNAAILQPVRDSWSMNKPIEWTRVHNLPEYVYFNHSIHVQKGIGCSTCHGQVDAMPITWQTSQLQMQWCLTCHRQPERYIRPRDQVFNMAWQPPADQMAAGVELIKQYHVGDEQELTNCSTCHR